MVLTVVVCTCAWLLGWVAFGRPRTLGRATDPGSACTVIIPARNEAATLRDLLDDLVREQRGGMHDHRIIVVDDHSTDDTSAVAASVPGVEVVASPPLPHGWTGKSWACWHGVEQATGNGEGDALQMVFLDADVRLEPGALDQLRSAHEQQLGLVSVQPHHMTRRPYEQLSALFNVIAIMGVGAGHRRPPTGAFGPVLATSFADYRSVGGHAAVRGDIAEDLSLARRYRARDLPVNVYAGRESFRFRMYPNGLSQLVEGWTKNFCTGALATRVPTLLAIVVWVIGLGSAAIGLGAALSGGDTVLRSALYVLFVGQFWWMLRAVGRFSWWISALYPVALVTFFAVFARSMFRTVVRRNVIWKGRTITLRQDSRSADSGAS